MEVWIGRQGERHGPYQEEQVREWLRNGQVSRDDLGWYDGLADWQPLSVLFPDAVASKQPPPLTTAPRPMASAYATPGHLYAGFWKRVAAYFVDVVVLYIVNTLLEIPFGMRAANEAFEQKFSDALDMQALMAGYQQFWADHWGYFLTTLIVGWLYFAICESSAWQATPGKLALGIRVTDLHGARISFGRALGRYGGKFISALLFCVGFLLAGITKRKQALHDTLAGTLVVNGRANAPGSGPSTRVPNDKTSFDA
jgi:uncharacterized RDD family membrane protein YckC